MQPGVCYKLYTRQVEKEVMEDFPKPEILRVPLEQVSLSAKLMNEEADIRVSILSRYVLAVDLIGNDQDLLGQTIDPPDSTTIDQAWLNLQELGAIDPLNNLTPLGRHMAMLPLDIRLAKVQTARP
jgi:HrpA-like RNA helicase